MRNQLLPPVRPLGSSFAGNCEFFRLSLWAILFLGSLVVFAASSSPAVAYHIAGTVTLDETGDSVGDDPLPGVYVTAGGHHAYTGPDGIYVIGGLEAGKYDVIPHKPGYAFDPASRQVTLGPSTGHIDFVGAETGLWPTVFDSGPRVATLVIDENPYPPSQQPKKFFWEDGSEHTAKAPAKVVTDGHVFVFVKWMKYTDHSWTVYSTHPEISVTADAAAHYVAKYRLGTWHVGFSSHPRIAPLIIDGNVVSPDNQPKYFVWEDGSIHTAHAPETVEHDGSEWHFVRWWKYVHHAWSIYSSDNEITVTANKNALFVAEYVGNHIARWPVVFDSWPRHADLTINGVVYPPTDQPVTFYWPIGKVVEIEAPAIVNHGETTLVFHRWLKKTHYSWIVLSTDPQTTITVDGPAYYRADYALQE